MTKTEQELIINIGMQFIIVKELRGGKDEWLFPYRAELKSAFQSAGYNITKPIPFFSYRKLLLVCHCYVLMAILEFCKDLIECNPTDTGSLRYLIKTKDACEDLFKDKHLLNNSENPNQKIPAINKHVGLRSKMYSYTLNDICVRDNQL
ncbi:hypothetical protein MAR_036652 [Mya arenaria]|uniref:Uncharacterized protein n=1 Tax=Mya arenaria TaxID=6604 RepID=A0ABY7FL94_MYAAR|nr:hypothetical protein MAR_036652 [Mya arenaria]